jgi:outer membrane protein
MNNKLNVILCVTAIFGAAITGTAMAHEQGDWLLRAGVSRIDPKSDNHDIASVEAATSATINLAYMFTRNLSVELLAAYPFEHDIDLLDGTNVGSTKHLPPTLSVQYHFLPDAGFQPYIGVGVNYTTFFSVDTTGPLEGTNLELSDSWGLAGEIGVDIPVGENWFLNLDARYISIGTDATLDGADLGEVEIDPWVFGGHVGFRF